MLIALIIGKLVNNNMLKIFDKNKILKIKFADKINHLIKHYKNNNFENVITSGNNLLKEFPNNALIKNIVGVALYQLKKNEEAKIIFYSAIKNDKKNFEAYNNLGIIYDEAGNHKKAQKKFKKAISLNESYSDAYNNLGIIEKKLLNYELSLYAFEKAFSLDQKNEKIVLNYSEILIFFNKIKIASLILKKYLDHNPKSYLSYHLLGQLYEKETHFDLAIKNYKKAIFINEKFLPSISLVGKIYSDNGANSFARLFFEKGLTILNKANFILPGALDFCLYAGMFYNRINRPDIAYECFNKATKIDPNFVPAKVEKFQMMRAMCNWKDFYHAKKFISQINIEDTFIQPYSILIQYDLPFKQKLFAENFAKKSFSKIRLQKELLQRKPPKKIRIGYLSADFLEHPVGKLLLKMISFHNREKFEIICYSFRNRENCEIQKKFKMFADYFINIENLSNEEIIKVIRKDNIQIAIDLMGYTTGSRPEIFSHGISPIQINYLGFSSTLGAKFIDYIVADKITIPKTSEKYYTEKIIRLPNSFMPTDNNQPISKKELTRSEMGLPEDAMVFCSFNRGMKICPDVFNIWMDILLEIKGSVLWLSKQNIWVEKNLQNEANRRGVNPSRLIFAKKVRIDEHLKRHQLADLFLDTFDYNSHSTAVDSLWSGLPLVTKMGKGFQARIASSLLTSLGMNELITKSNKEYKDLILKLAYNPKKIVELKNKIKQKITECSLFDTYSYAKDFEESLTKVYFNYRNLNAH